MGYCWGNDWKSVDIGEERMCLRLVGRCGGDCFGVFVRFTIYDFTQKCTLCC